jgi:hypothetical protein
MTNEVKITTSPASFEMTDDELASWLGGDKASCRAENRALIRDAGIDFAQGDLLGGMSALSQIQKC